MTTIISVPFLPCFITTALISTTYIPGTAIDYYLVVRMGLEKHFLWRFFMLRLAVVLLVGATFVTAQTAGGPMMGMGSGSDRTIDTAMHDDTGMGAIHVRDSAMQKDNDSGEVHVFDTTRLGEKIKDAMDRCGSKADSAREVVRGFREEMRDTADGDTAKVMDQHRAMKRERLQGAIDALDKVSERMGAQVKGASDQAQTRIMERRDELIQKQERIREHLDEVKADSAATE